MKFYIKMSTAERMAEEMKKTEVTKLKKAYSLTIFQAILIGLFIWDGLQYTGYPVKIVNKKNGKFFEFNFSGMSNLKQSLLFDEA